MKLVINKCFGGFGLSHKAIMRYAEIKGFKLYRYYEDRDVKSRKIYLWKEGDAEPHLSYYYSDPNLTQFPESSESTDLDYEQAIEELDEIVSVPDYSTKMFYERYLERNDPILVLVVEELGSEANGQYANLSIVDIPEDVRWEIDDYDGMESVEEKHRSWG